MRTDKINNEFIPRLIAGKRYRIIRHFFMQIVIGLMLYSIDIKEDYIYEYGWHLEKGILLLLLVGIVYFNIYYLISQFLLKEKLFLYLFCLLLLVTLLLSCIVIAQIYLHSMTNKSSSIIEGIFNIGGNFIVITVVIACTTSLILFRNWILNSQQIKELSAITLQTELQLLKNQINPHFLFNTLNNANIMIRKDSQTASQILTRLEQLLTFQLETSLKNSVPLMDDIFFLDNYLNLEKTRRNRFEYNMKYNESELSAIIVPPLLFIPFVENAVKHSLGKGNESSIYISFSFQGNDLNFTCKNSKPEIPLSKDNGGLGLPNIKRRLSLLFQQDYSLIFEETETSYMVNLIFKL